MNKSFQSSKSKENTPIKGVRQATLFDMKFKSKTNDSGERRSVLGDESNRKLNVSVSDVTIEEQVVKTKPNSSPKRAKSSPAKSSPSKKESVEVIEVDEVQPTTSPKSKKTSPKKASPKRSPSEKKQQEPSVDVKKLKIYNFFVRVPHAEVAAANAKIFKEENNVKMEKSIREQTKKQLKEEEAKRKLARPYLLGKRVFEADEAAKEKFIVQNHMFGDLASVVEFYNTFSSIYDNKTSFKYLAKRDKIEFTKIKFDDLVSMLNANMESYQSRMYYSKLIESLLKILLKYESIYEKYELFGTELIGVELDDNTIQDLCRIVATLIFKEHHENEITERELLLPDELEEEKHKILKELRINQDNDLFKGLNVESRLELLSLLCEQVLYGENFLKQKETIEARIDTMRAGIRELKASLKEEFDFALTSRSYDKDKNLKVPKEIQEDEKKLSMFMKLVQKLKDGETKLKSSENMLNKFSRIEPLSTDTNGFLYWHFSCMDGIILEKRSASEDGSAEVQSEWYSFTTKDELDNLISVLQQEPENAKLVNALKRKYEKIFGQKSKLELAQTKKETTADIGKLLTGEVDKKSAEVPEPGGLNLRNMKFSKDDPAELDLEKGVKYLEIEESEEEETAEKQPSQFKTKLDKLLERVLHVQQRAALNEDEYGAKKQVIITSYFENYKSFEEKFSFIKTLLIESFETFSADGHLKPGILDADKSELWKQCVETSESLSNLYLLNFLFAKQVNWPVINQKKKIKTVEDDEEAELRARRRKARDELEESRPYSLRTLKKVNYEAEDEQLDKLIEEEQPAEDEEEAMETDDAEDDPDAAEPEEETESSDSDSEEEHPTRRSMRNNKSSTLEAPTRRSLRNAVKESSESPEPARRSLRAKASKEEETAGRRRSSRLSKPE